MSDTDPVTDAPPAKKAGSRTVVAAVLVVVALAVLAAAFWYVGGVDYVAALFGSPAPVAVTPASDSTPATTTPGPSDVPDALAKRMYMEQIESARHIDRLASGQTTEFTIDKVETKSPTETWVSISARFTTQPTTMKGVMAFSKAGGNWYFLWIQAAAGTSPKLTEPTEPTSEEYAEAGVKTVDQEVIDAVLGSQVANQALVVGILDGTYTTIALSKPVTGPGTIAIPVTASGGGGTVKGSLTLITKQIDGKDRTFVASFKKQ